MEQGTETPERGRKRLHLMTAAKAPLANNVERTVEESGFEIDNGIVNDNEACNAGVKFADSPLANNVILENIMSYLPLEDLKSARLVCKKWKEEASKPLEKKAAVSFTFHQDYYNQENSSRVFRYLHEMRDMKVRNLSISLRNWCSQNRLFFSPGEPGEKVMDDLRKLLNSSHNFSTLLLVTDFVDEPCFSPFSLILQDLGEKLVELNLEIYQLFVPAVVKPPFPLMRNLKKLTGESFKEVGVLEPKWASLLVPLFSNNLEYFKSWNTPVHYLEEFVKHRMPNLKGIELKEAVSRRTLSALLGLETRLNFLEIQYSKTSTVPKELLERLLLKHSPSLQTLVIRMGEGFFYNFLGTEIKFPSFPKLEQLELQYSRMARISWGTGFSYKDHFPALRKLTVKPLERWREDGPVFNAFFPEEGNLRCETVKELRVPILPHPEYLSPELMESLQPRMDQIREMFPNVEKINFLM